MNATHHREGVGVVEVPGTRQWTARGLVELVRLYSNPKAVLETLPKLLVKATSSPRPHERPASWQAQVRLDHYQANALAAAYRDGKTVNELADSYGIHRVTAASLLRRSASSDVGLVCPMNMSMRQAACTQKAGRWLAWPSDMASTT